MKNKTSASQKQNLILLLQVRRPPQFDVQSNSVRERQFLNKISALKDTAYDVWTSKAALLSEQVDIALMTMPSEMQYSEHAKIAYTLD
jgi:hypothetical protein